MWMMYLIALIPIVVGMFLWAFSKRITLTEYLLSCLTGIVVTVLITLLMALGMTGDIETWSGLVTKATHIPTWVNTYEQAHYVTVGKTTTVYYTTEYNTNPEHWVAEATLGSRGAEIGISEARYNDILKKFGREVVVNGSRPSYHSGDRNDYVAVNDSKYVYPITQEYSFTNKVKACPSVFSYTKVSPGIKVFEYPKNEDLFKSDRLMGEAKKDFNIYEFDKLNTAVGMKIWANIIIVGFKGQDSKIAQLQEAKWVGGKKNDLVICYSKEPKWAYVFGWTENEQVKRNLEELFTIGTISGNMLPQIQEVVMKDYKIKDWSKFDYLTVEPPGWAFALLIALMLLTQFGYYWWAFTNGEDKDESI